MIDRRKNRRVALNSKLAVESLFKSGEQQNVKSNFPITITDISKTGMGFVAEEVLPMDHYFNTRVVIDEKREFFCVLKIIRIKEVEDGFQYGSEFVGLAEVLSHDIDDYVSEVQE